MAKSNKDITTIAAKQRHLHLLGKVQGNQALSKSELDELKGYEQMTPGNKLPAKTGTGIAKRRYLSQAEAQRLGFECRCLAAADKDSGLTSNLSKYFERHPRVRAAFRRGRLLRYLVELAPNTLIYEAARRLKDLGFSQFDSAQGLRDFLDTDKEACELWETARVNGQIENRQYLRSAASSGNVKAIQLIDKWAVDRQKETSDGGSANFNRIGVGQMAELFGTTRQTIHDWYTTKGLPQNADGSFDLCRAIPWYEDFTLKKAVRGRDAVTSLNPFQAVKTERERLQLERDRGGLIERGRWIGYEIAVMQNVVNVFNSITDLANRVFGQPREQIVERLEDFRDEVMGKLQHIPAELKLSEPAEAKLVELFEILKPQTKTKKHEKGSATEGTEDTEKIKP